jgi:hypothetical protein
LITKTSYCNHCNVEFIIEKAGQKYCTIKCRKDFNKNKTYSYINICPDCNKQTTHTRKNTYGKIKNDLGNSKCKSCQQKNIEHQLKINYDLFDFWIDELRYFRNCPSCSCLLEYKTKYYAYQACLNNSKCLSCSSYGYNNGKIIQTLNKYNVETINEYEQLLPAKTLYYKKVWQITNKQDIMHLLNYDKRKGGGYALDHIYPIAAGFRNNIPCDLIGNIQNLQMLPKRINESKNDRIFIIPNHIQNFLDTK